MSAKRITVTVPEDLAQFLREAVASGEFDSVSAAVTQAVRRLRDFQPLDLLIASTIAEGGMPDKEADAWTADAMRKAETARLARGRRRPGRAA